MRRTALLVLAIAAAAMAPFSPAQAQGRINAVATFTILADLVAEVGGDRVAVSTLVGPEGDAHVFEPTPASLRAVAAADILFANGLLFEGWIERLISAARYEGPVVFASEGVRPLAFAERAGHAHHDHQHIGAPDPHAWQSVANARVYAANIAAALSALDPAGAAAYEANLARFLADLDVLDAEILASVAALPANRRVVITSHAAFGYFADAYGFVFLAPRGVSTDAEPTAATVAGLIDQIRAADVRAVFIESMSDPRLIEQIARETGAVVGGKLYPDALSAPDGPAPTYLEMMRHNIRTIVAALSR
jgi:zinc/manganese transport system substrate-binding protein